MAKNLVYDIHDKPKFGQMLIFAFQQVLAILAATILVPAIIGNGMSQSAALFGAGVGTIIYQLFTKFRSPVFLGSSFAFIGSMLAAFGGAASASAGYAGIILGAIFAGLVYVVIAIIVRFAGVAWINKLMPTVVIGPTVALIGLSLAVNAVNDLTVGKVMVESTSQITKTGESELLGLSIVLVLDGHILFEKSCDTCRNLILIALCLGRNSHCEVRLGIYDRSILNAGGESGKCIVGIGISKLCCYTDITACECVDVDLLLTAKHEDAVDAIMSGPIYWTL